jgi:hypothetical protein
MGKWSTIKFIEAFMEDTLGKKRVHGTYRVLEGDHCKALVRASTAYGKPSGSALIALSMHDETADVCFFHSHNTRCFTYRMTRDLDMYNAPKLPESVLHGDDANLLASGIIDANDTEVLIEIGDKPYLLIKKVGKDGIGFKFHGMIPRFSSCERIRTRVATIKEAKAQIQDPPGAEQLVGSWWIDRQPAGFKPKGLDESYLQILSDPVHPLNHGYTLEDCSIHQASAYDNAGIGVLLPGPELLKEPHDQRATSYLAARFKWNEACEAVKNRSPLTYDQLTVKKNKYSYRTDDTSRTGWIIRTTNGVYVRGHIKNTENWDQQARLEGWYKLNSRINRISLV